MTCLKIIENIPQHQQNYKLRINKTKCFNYDAISVIMSNMRCCNNKSINGSVLFYSTKNNLNEQNLFLRYLSFKKHIFQ